MNIERIRSLLASYKISEVAQDSGVSVRTLFRFKRGDMKNPTLDTLRKLEDWSKGKRVKVNA